VAVWVWVLVDVSVYVEVSTAVAVYVSVEVSVTVAVWVCVFVWVAVAVRVVVAVSVAVAVNVTSTLSLAARPAREPPGSSGGALVPHPTIRERIPATSQRRSVFIARTPVGLSVPKNNLGVSANTRQRIRRSSIEINNQRWESSCASRRTFWPSGARRPYQPAGHR